MVRLIAMMDIEHAKEIPLKGMSAAFAYGANHSW